MFKSSKKAQITIFIVIGIIILIGTSFIFYVYSQKSDEGQPIETALEFEYQGQEEIYNYVTACMKPAVLEGLEIMRLRGGHIFVSPSEDFLLIKDSRDRVVKLINGSLKVVQDPDSVGNAVPYWVGNGYVDIPSIEFLENELELYAELETAKCVANLDKFREQGYDIEFGTLDIDVDMKNAVVVDMEMPLKVSRNDLSFELGRFSYQVPVNWEKILDAATDIALFESANMYMEDFTMQMISVYSAPDENMLPPVSSTIPSMDCDSITWDKDEVHARLMAIMRKNTGNIRIKNTNNQKLTSSNNETQNYYDSLEFDILENGDTLKIDHRYNPSWGMNFGIKPIAGNEIRGDITHATGIPMLSSFCSVKYNFKYSVEYPVQVRIEDMNSADIDPFTNSYDDAGGYQFSIPLRVVVYGNQKREFVPKSPKLVAFEQAAFEAAEKMDIDAQDLLFCDEDQRLTDNITVTVRDIYTNQPVEGVDLFFQLPYEADTCFIARTEEDGTATSRYPVCHNCLLKLSRQGYAMNKHYMSTDKDQKSFNYYIEPMNDLKLNVMHIYLPDFMKKFHETDGFTKSTACTGEDAESAYLGTFRSIGPREKVMLTISSEDIGLDYSETLLYPTVDRIKIPSGNFSVEGLVTGRSNIEPSDYPAGQDKEVTVSMHPTGRGTYKGMFIQGNFGYDFEINVLNASEITFFTLANYLASETVDVDRVTTGTIIKEDGLLEYSYDYDHDCNQSTPEKDVTVRLTREQYEKLLTPMVR